jgi:hypothetical protein
MAGVNWSGSATLVADLALAAKRLLEHLQQVDQASAPRARSDVQLSQTSPIVAGDAERSAGSGRSQAG